MNTFWSVTLHTALLAGPFLLAGSSLCNLHPSRRHAQSLILLALLATVVALGLGHLDVWLFGWLPGILHAVAVDLVAILRQWLSWTWPDTLILGVVMAWLLLLGKCVLLLTCFPLLWLWPRLHAIVTRLLHGRCPYLPHHPGRLALLPAYQFDPLQLEVTLRPGWVALRPLLRVFSRGGLLLLALLLAVASWREISGQPLATPPPQWVFATWVLLTFVAWEALNYLEGNEPCPQNTRFDGENVGFDRQNLHEALWLEYQRLWGDRLLCLGFQEAANVPASQTPEGDGHPLLEQLRPVLEAAGLEVTEELGQTLNHFESGRSCRFAGADGHRLAPALFIYFQELFLQGYHVLLLVDDRDSGDLGQIAGEVGAWLQKGLAGVCTSPDFWPVMNSVDGLLSGRQEHPAGSSLWAVGLGELERRWQHEGVQDWLAEAGLLVIYEADGAGWHLSRLFSLAQLLRERMARPQTLILGADLTGAEGAAGRNLGLETLHELPLNRHHPATIGMVWPQEAEDYSESLSDVFSGQSLGVAHALAVPALGRLPALGDTDPACRLGLVGERSTAYLDFFEHLGHCASRFSEPYQLDNGQLHGIRRALLPALAPAGISDHLLAIDEARNFPWLLNRLMEKAKNKAFIHLIAPPSLLRDYFAANLHYFLKDPERPLAPVLSDQPGPAAERLLRTLTLQAQDPDELLQQVRLCGIDSSTAEVGLNLLFRREFGVELLATGLLRSSPEGLDLDPRVAARLPLQWLDSVTIRARHTDGEQALARVPRDHLYQRFLPGQLHAFGGKLYRISQIDARHPVVTANQVDPHEDYLAYRPQVLVRIDTLAPAMAEAQAGITHRSSVDRILPAGRLRVRKVSLDCRIATLGYHEFRQGRFGVFQATHDVPDRHYPAARALELAWFPVPSGATGHRSRLSLTLALLLQETLPSLLPSCDGLLRVVPLHTPHALQLAPTNAVDSDAQRHLIGPDGREIPPDAFAARMPLVDWHCAPDAAIGCLILEDSHTDLGAVPALFEHLQVRVLPLLADYLRWLLEEAPQPGSPPQLEPLPLPSVTFWTSGPLARRPFLAFGEATLSEDLDLAGVLALLAPWVDGARTTQRRRFNESRRHAADEAAGRIDTGTEAGRNAESVVTVDAGAGTASGATNGAPPRGGAAGATAGADQAACDLCGTPRRLVQLSRLRDGRLRCHTCSRQAVDSVAEAYQILINARRYLEQRFSIRVPDDVEARLMNARDLSAASGFIFEPSPGLDWRAIGLVRFSPGQTPQLGVEAGMPRYMTMATMLHELTHLWQLRNLTRIKTTPLRLLEGHAVLAELTYLEERGHAHRYCRQLRESTHPLYGEGLREMEGKMAEEGEKNPFRYLLKHYAG